MKTIYVDRPIFGINKKGKISFDTKNDNYKTFDLSRGFINKTISDVEKEYNNNKNSKFLIIFSYNNMLRPYYSSEFGISINYIILDENLKEIENYISNDDIEEMKEELRLGEEKRVIDSNNIKDNFRD